MVTRGWHKKQNSSSKIHPCSFVVDLVSLAPADSLWAQDAWRKFCQQEGPELLTLHFHEETALGKSNVKFLPCWHFHLPILQANCRIQTVLYLLLTHWGWRGTLSSFRSPGWGGDWSYQWVCSWSPWFLTEVQEREKRGKGRCPNPGGLHTLFTLTCHLNTHTHTPLITLYLAAPCCTATRYRGFK